MFKKKSDPIERKDMVWLKSNKLLARFRYRRLLGFAGTYKYMTMKPALKITYVKRLRYKTPKGAFLTIIDLC